VNKTPLIALALAVLTSLWTWWPKPEVTSAPKDERSQVLTASGAQVKADTVAGIRVVIVDELTNEARPFEVKRSGGQWTIPSHFDYPADGGTRVGETAGAMLNIPMGPLVTADKAQHAEYGVQDPLDAEADVGAGKRVTLSDEGGGVLVDVIIGKRKTNTNVYFVRRANEDQVYTAKVQPEQINASFKDWVETSLLKIATNEIREVTVKDYSVDEASGSVTKRSMVVLSQNKGELHWTLRPSLPDKVIKSRTADTLAKEIAKLALVGVRPFGTEWLQERGFYLGRTATEGQQLYGNEGEVQVVSHTGLVFRLYFGEIALGDESDKTAKKALDGKPSGNSSTNHNRYMAIFVQYNPAFDETIPAPEVIEPKETSTPDAPEPMRAAPRLPKNQEEITAALKRGQERAEEAQTRFQKFFYVVSDESFRKLRPAGADFYQTAQSAP
jgi:hypothetical protein